MDGQLNMMGWLYSCMLILSSTETGHWMILGVIFCHCYNVLKFSWNRVSLSWYTTFYALTITLCELWFSWSAMIICFVCLGNSVEFYKLLCCSSDTALTFFGISLKFFFCKWHLKIFIEYLTMSLALYTFGWKKFLGRLFFRRIIWCQGYSLLLLLRDMKRFILKLVSNS